MRICVFVRPAHNSVFPVLPGATVRLEELPGYRPAANPFDEFSLELALGLRDRFPGSVHVTACSVGTEAARKVLREFLACGADQTVHVLEPLWEPDSVIVASLLNDFYRSASLDLGLFGTRDSDTGDGAVGPMFSVLSGIPYVDNVVEVHWDGGLKIEVVRRAQKLSEHIRMELPACLGILRGKPLRYPSFWGKRRAEKTAPLTRGSRPLLTPRVERLRFTPSKPRRRSGLEVYTAASGADRMRQAFGLAPGDVEKKGQSLIQGSPETLARKILGALKQEKVLDLAEPDQKT